MSQNTGHPGRQRSRTAHRSSLAGLHSWAATMAFLLLADFLFGVTVTLFVHVPASHPGANAAGYFAGSGRALWWAMTQGEVWLAVHTALSLAMIALALAFVVAALFHGRNAHDARWLWISGLGALFMLGGGFGGTAFLIHPSAVSSMVMATCFALSLCTYLAGLYLDVPADAHHI